MTLKANTNLRYYWRFGLIAAFCIGFALWSLYDGYYKYPKQRERALKYQELVGKYEELVKANKLGELEARKKRLDEWKAIAEEKSWPHEDPGKPKDDTDIAMQYIQAVVAGLTGLLFLWVVLRSRGRWIEGNETGLHTSWGQELEFGQIVTLNKRKWRDKGIAKIKYEVNGRKRNLVLDDCKYDRQPTQGILRQVESRIETDQIVGGVPEQDEEDHLNEEDEVARSADS